MPKLLQKNLEYIHNLKMWPRAA